MGDSITTAVLLSWSKNPGDAVKEDDVIGVVETDKVLDANFHINNFTFLKFCSTKVTMEIRAKKSGIFVQGLVAPGAEVNTFHLI